MKCRVGLLVLGRMKHGRSLVFTAVVGTMLMAFTFLDILEKEGGKSPLIK